MYSGRSAPGGAMDAGVDASAEAMTEYSVFEGMFVRALRPEGGFAEELKRAGYDVERPQLRYPTTVWKQAVNIARRHVYPALPTEEADRALGRRFVEGFFNTIAGKFVQVAIPFVGPAGTLKRLPKYYKAARSHVRIEVIQEAPTRFRVVYVDPFPLPDFVAGMIEGTTRFLAAHPLVDVLQRSACGFELLVRW